MNKEFIKKLKKLTKEYNLELFNECVFCGHGKECLDNNSTCYYFTVTEKEKKQS